MLKHISMRMFDESNRDGAYYALMAAMTETSSPIAFATVRREAARQIAAIQAQPFEHYDNENDIAVLQDIIDFLDTRTPLAVTA